MNRTKIFAKNFISTALLQIFTFISGFIIPRIILVYYGSEINGLMSSISQFISYFSLVEAGLAGAATYSLYKPLAEKDVGAINGIITAAKKFYNFSGYLFTALTIGLALIYPIFIETNVLSKTEIGILVIVIGVSGSMEFFTMSKYRVLLTADQKVYILSIASIVSIIINTSIIAILSSMSLNIVIIRLVALLSFFTRTGILYAYVKRKYKFIDFCVPANYSALDKRWDALYLQVLGTVQTGLPVVYLTLFCDIKVVSVHSIYNMFLVGINGLLSIFIAGLSSSFGDIIARDDLELFQKAYDEFEFAYYSLIAFAYSATFVLISPLVEIYTRGITDINYNLPLTGFLFTLNGLVYNIKTPQGMLISSAGLFKETKKQTTIQALIIIVLGIPLVNLWGMNGILVASIVSNIYRDIDLVLYMSKHLLKRLPQFTFMRLLRMLVLIAVICTPLYFVKLQLADYLQFLAAAICFSIFAIIIIFLYAMIFERNQLICMKNRFFALVKK